MSLRERGYLVPRGRGRGTLYRLAKRLEHTLGEEPGSIREGPFDDEGLRLRLRAVLAERGFLTNETARRISGLSRPEVLRLMRGLRKEGLVRLVGRGRAARYVPGRSLARERKRGRARRSPRARS